MEIRRRLEMKKILKMFVIGVVVLFFLSLGTSFGVNKCYAGDSLCGSTVKEWKQANRSDKRSAVYAWIIAANLNKRYVNPNALIVCIDEAVSGHTTADNENTSSIAAMCMIIMGWK